MWKRMLLASRRHPELRNSASAWGWYSPCRDADTSTAGGWRIKNIFRGPAGAAGRVDLRSNISSQIDTIPQTSVVRKPSRAPVHLPPILSLSLFLPIRRLYSQISSKLEHRQDVDKPVIDVGNSTNPRAALATRWFDQRYTYRRAPYSSEKDDLYSDVHFEMNLYKDIFFLFF